MLVMSSKIRAGLVKEYKYHKLDLCLCSRVMGYAGDLACEKVNPVRVFRYIFKLLVVGN